MNTQSLVSFSEKLHTILEKNSDLFDSDVDHFKKANAIDDPKSLEQTFAELQNESRLLNIGIVGRVKAGKSSLLNALVFQGESILPKAATPMTAALTTLTWGEEFQVDVEFFSQADVDGIQKNAEKYEAKLTEKGLEILTELQSIKNKWNDVTKSAKNLATNAGKAPASPVEPKEMAYKRALRFMQDHHPELCAAFDQSLRMKKTGIRLENLEKEGRIKAANPQELAKKLQDYVGAEGRFMPFAKAVHIHMPLEDLRDVRVIDTPGMNDPVQSREARTTELLKTCDVVFIVSPAGQFLNEQDLDVMGRITTKEGVQKLVLVTSQVDTQLYGSEKRTRLDDALTSIHDQLSKRAVQALGDLKQRSPEVGSVFDDLLHAPKTHLLHSSGVCHSLSKRHAQRQCWDANEQQTWKNLCNHYPDYFSDANPELSRASLDKLANMAAIHDVLREVRAQKDALLANKITKLWEQKRASLENFQRELHALAEKRINLIQSTDAKGLEVRRKHLENQSANLSLKFDGIYNECLVTYHGALRDTLARRQIEIFKESESELEGAKGTDIETRKREKSGISSWFARKIWGGGYESYTETVMTIATGPVHSALHAFLMNIEEELGQIVLQSRIDFDKNLSATLVPALSAILGHDFDLDMLVATIRDATNRIPDPEFSLGITIPDELKSRGTLKSHEAEQYKNDSVDFLHELKTKSREKINTYIKNVRSNFPKTISDTFVQDLGGKITTLKAQIENAAQTIDRLNRAIRAIKETAL